MAQLAAMGLATQVAPSIYRVSNVGHRLLGEVMARNAARSREWRSR